MLLNNIPYINNL